LAVLRCEQAVAGYLRAVLCGALALLRGAGDELETGERTCALVLIGGGVELRHRQIPGVGGLVAGQCGQIPEPRDRVALIGYVQTVPGGQFTLPSRALADTTAELVSCPIDAGCEIVIAGGLVAGGRDLVELRTGLIVLRGALIGIGERLISLAGSLIALDQRPLIAAGQRRGPCRRRA